MTTASDSPAIRMKTIYRSGAVLLVDHGNPDHPTLIGPIEWRVYLRVNRPSRSDRNRGADTYEAGVTPALDTLLLYNHDGETRKAQTLNDQEDDNAMPASSSCCLVRGAALIVGTVLWRWPVAPPGSVVFVWLR